jgi:hypothetical protein
MTPETVYELRVTTDNIPNPSFSLSPVRWSGGTNGLWYIGTANQVWPNGVYDFTIFIDGIAKGTASIIIGGTPTNSPTISDIVFGLSDFDGTPLGNGYVLPTGNVASARFIYRDMENGMEWVARWFYEGNEVFRTPPDIWRDDTDGAKTISIQDPNGLLPGRYRLELYVENRLTGTSDFTIAGAARGAFPEVFTDTHFASADSIEAAITAPANSNFTNNIDTLYALFDWTRIAQNTRVIVRWSVDGEVFFQSPISWNRAESGENFVITLERSGGLPDGTYQIDLFIGQIQLASAEAVVGIGQLPIDRFAQSTGIRLQGRILDADTRQGIDGVTFVLISEDYSVADFVWDNEQVYDLATTDRNGNFQFNRLLEISTEDNSVPYSAVISAKGYIPIEADGIVVNEETENPLSIVIYMTRE